MSRNAKQTLDPRPKNRDKVKQVPKFSCTSPCGSCPYLTTSPIRLWDKVEFEKVLDAEENWLGASFDCHKQNNSICVGFLMDQDKRGLPSIALRLVLSKHELPENYFDKLKSVAPLYTSYKAMIRANYPSLLRRRKKNHGKEDFDIRLGRR